MNVKWRALIGGIGIWGVLWLGGCATYSESIREVERQIALNQPQKALEILEKKKPGKADQVLFLLNKGNLLRLAGSYEESNKVLEEAKVLMDELSAVSITEQATSLIVNDSTKSYVGSDFEQVFIHLYKALNYIDLGKLDDARVEAFQVDIKLRLLAGQTKDAVFTEEALSRYLTGMIYEELAEWSDALIAYRKSYEGFQHYKKKYGVDVPRSLQLALLRLTERQGLKDEMRGFMKEFGIEKWDSVNDLKQKGELVVFLFNGLAPLKQSVEMRQVNPSSGRMVSIAVPKYVSRPQFVRGGQARLGKDVYPLELVEDIDSIARKSLDKQMPAIIARTFARAVIKDNTARQVQKNAGEVAGLIVNIAGAISERADTRSWSTLPSSIYMVRIPVEPGKYQLSLELNRTAGGVVTAFTFPEVEVKAAQKRYMTYHWVMTH